MIKNFVQQMNIPELIPVSKVNDYIPYPSSAAIRQYIFKNTNGFKDKVVRILGKRQYLKMSDFYAWVDSNSNSVA